MVKPPPAFSYGLFLRQVNASLQPVLGGEEIVAAAKVVSGPPPYPIGWLCAAGGVLLTVVLSTLGFTSHSRPGALWRAEIAVALGPAALSLIQRYFQRPMLVAVTRQQVVVTRRTAFRDPRRHVVVTRASDAMITAGRRTRWTTTIVLATQGTGPLQLNAIRRQRAELDHVLAAAQSAGVAISASAAINDSATGTPTVLPLPPTRA